MAFGNAKNAIYLFLVRWAAIITSFFFMPRSPHHVQQDTLVPEPIRIMLGGSAANFAVHATTLGGSNVHYDDDNRQTDRPIAAAATDNRPPYRQSCVLHSSVGEEVRRQ